MRIYESLVKVCFDILYLTVHLNCVMYRFGYTMRWVLCPGIVYIIWEGHMFIMLLIGMHKKMYKAVYP